MADMDDLILALEAFHITLRGPIVECEASKTTSEKSTIESRLLPSHLEDDTDTLCETATLCETESQISTSFQIIHKKEECFEDDASTWADGVYAELLRIADVNSLSHPASSTIRDIVEPLLLENENALPWSLNPPFLNECGADTPTSSTPSWCEGDDGLCQPKYSMISTHHDMSSWISQEARVRLEKSLKEEGESEVESLDEDHLAGAVAYIGLLPAGIALPSLIVDRLGPSDTDSNFDEAFFEEEQHLYGRITLPHPLPRTRPCWEPPILGYSQYEDLIKAREAIAIEEGRRDAAWRTEAFDLCLEGSLLSEYGEWADESQQSAMDKGEWAEAEFLRGLRVELRRDLVDVSEEAEEFPERFGLDGKADEYLQRVEDEAYKLRRLGALSQKASSTPQTNQAEPQSPSVESMAPTQHNREDLSNQETFSVSPPPQDLSLNSEASSTYLPARHHLLQHVLEAGVRKIDYTGFGFRLLLPRSSFFSSRVGADTSVSTKNRVVESDQVYHEEVD